MRRRLVAAVVVLVVVAGFLVHAGLYRGWVEDDAYITFRYARNLVEGEGLVFNPGVRVEGYSNLLWVLYTAAALATRSDPVAAAQTAGLLAGVIGLLLSWRLARLLNPESPVAALLAPAWLAAGPLLTRHAVSGLETVPYGVALTAAVALVCDPVRWRIRQTALVVALALVVTLRPEGVAMAALVLVWDWRAGRSGWREATVLLALAAAWQVWRVAYYGELLPNTFHFKLTGGAAAIMPGVHHGLDFFRENAGPLLLAGGLALWLRPAARRPLSLVLALLALQTAIVVAAGGDWMHHYRFFTPLLPVLAAVLAAGAGLAAGRLGRTRGTYAPGWFLVGLVVLASYVNVYKTERHVWRNVMPAVHAGEYLTQSYARVGRWLAANTPPGSTVAASDVGAIGYHSRRPILDMLGLVDRHIARTPGALHLKRDAGYVLASAPDYVVLVAGPDTSGEGRYRRVADRVLADHAGFHAMYDGVATIEMGFLGEAAQIFARRDEGGT